MTFYVHRSVAGSRTSQYVNGSRAVQPHRPRRTTPCRFVSPGARPRGVQRLVVHHRRAWIRDRRLLNGWASRWSSKKACAGGGARMFRVPPTARPRSSIDETFKKLWLGSQNRKPSTAPIDGLRSAGRSDPFGSAGLRFHALAKTSAGGETYAPVPSTPCNVPVSMSVPAPQCREACVPDARARHGAARADATRSCVPRGPRRRSRSSCARRARRHRRFRCGRRVPVRAGSALQGMPPPR